MTFSNLATSRRPVQDEEPLDLSGSGPSWGRRRQYGRSSERQEDRRIPNPSPPYSERVPLDLPQKWNSIRSDEDIFDGRYPKVEADNVSDNDIKAKVDDLQ